MRLHNQLYKLLTVTFTQTQLCGHKGTLPGWLGRLLQATNVASFGTKAPVRYQESEFEEFHSILKSEKKLAGAYILDRQLAEDVGTAVTDRLKPNSTVLECCPGVGLVTDHLLRSGLCKVIAAEPKQEFMPYLKKQQEVHRKSRLDIEEFNVFKYVRTVPDQETFFGILRKVKDKPWEAVRDPHSGQNPFRQPSRSAILSYITDDLHISYAPLCVFGVVPVYRDGSFLRYLMLQIATQMGFYSIGRTEFFLFLSPRDYRLMNVKFPTPDLRFHHRFSILFQLFFDFDCLLQVDKSRFIPPFPKRSRKHMDVTKSMEDILDPSMMYLVHLKPKRDIYTSICPAVELPKFAAFLKQVTRNKSLRVIPKMESWVPGSGVHLILMNYTMLHKFQNLVPNDYVQIYQAMVKWPEYEESSLQLLLDKDTALLLEEDLEPSPGKGESDSPEHGDGENIPVPESDRLGNAAH